jgi:serine protease Do
VIGADAALDVVLLRIEGEPGQPTSPVPAMPRQGQAILAMGDPNGWGFSLWTGIVSRYGEASGMFKALPHADSQPGVIRRQGVYPSYTPA